MIDFLRSHYKEIAIVVAFIIYLAFSFIMIVKKQKKEAPIITEILELLPDVICSVEKSIGSGNGLMKKTLVLDAISKWASAYGVELDRLSIQHIEAAIERILSTPQKKGE